MSFHQIRFQQIVPAALDEVWQFFATPKNLPRITPPHLKFEILTPVPEKMYPGLMIGYRVRPLLGIPVHWLTEITQIEPQQFFVDEQRLGPYRIWHHEHHFRPVDGGVEMQDIITYQMPFGWLSAPLHALVVKKQLEQIFAFRTHSVREIFGEIPK
jgi:ligand-binding SRPBCC domain-containing protein